MKPIKEISAQIRNSITQFIEAVESTESRLDKTILDMKKRLAEAKDLVATAIAEEERLKRAYQEAIDTAEMWRKKVDIALQRDDLAGVSEARQHKRQQLQRADDYKRQMDAQKAVVNRLKTALHGFYHQFQDALKRSEVLCHRQKQADTRAKLYKLLSDEIVNDASNVFRQAEQRLETTEAEAEMWERESRSKSTEAKTTDGNFNLDQALAELKADVLDNDRK